MIEDQCDVFRLHHHNAPHSSLFVQVRIAELGLEGELDGRTAELEAAFPVGSGYRPEMSALLQFSEEGVTGKISNGNLQTDICGFKFGENSEYLTI